MRRIARWALLTWAVWACAACRPDLPGRDCAQDRDCFSGEACVEAVCVPEADAAQGAGGDAGTDAGPGA